MTKYSFPPLSLTSSRWLSFNCKVTCTETAIANTTGEEEFTGSEGAVWLFLKAELIEQTSLQQLLFGTLENDGNMANSNQNASRYLSAWIFRYWNNPFTQLPRCYNLSPASFFFWRGAILWHKEQNNYWNCSWFSSSLSFRIYFRANSIFDEPTPRKQAISNVDIISRIQRWENKKSTLPLKSIHAFYF